ncbi:MAG: polymerase subunit alpha, partial [Solirubrobacteraceae bacterium]|nr:polymerase subunit alpha [Solirubrobacteraceae bacterium]
TGASRKGMLAVLEQAQGAGQKTQLDAQIGQGSIFDFGDQPSSAGGAAAFAAPSHPAIPAEEHDQAELLALEKESIGLFISAHPLKPLREALRMRVDGSLSELCGRGDGEWVTAGGIITQAKKIRTKKGDPMMFATLDDLEGSLEILVFGKALASYEGALGVDSVVLVRGRVDHKDAAKTCLVAQEAEPFAPSPEEIEKAKEQAAKRAMGPVPLRLSLDAGALPAGVVEELKSVLETFPGESDVVLEMTTPAGPRRLRLGPAYRVAPSASLRAELDELLGAALSGAAAA